MNDQEREQLLYAAGYLTCYRCGRIGHASDVTRLTSRYLLATYSPQCRHTEITYVIDTQDRTCEETP